MHQRLTSRRIIIESYIYTYYLLIVKSFYITKYNLVRCEKYERVGTYERIKDSAGFPLYGIIPVDKDTVSSLAASPILYIVKNEDRVYEVDKKYRRKFMCMFKEGVRVVDEPSYIVLDGESKKEIMRVTRTCQEIGKITVDKKTVMDYRYTFDIGDLKLIFKPILKENKRRTQLFKRMEYTDDLGNITTGCDVDYSTPFGIYRGDNLIYANFYESDIIKPPQDNCSCCTCCNCEDSPNNQPPPDEVTYSTNDCCKNCCSGCNFLCITIPCPPRCPSGGDSGIGGGPITIPRERNGPSAETMHNVWLKVGNEEEGCCTVARGKTNVNIKYINTVIRGDKETALSLIKYGRIEGKFGQEYVTNSTLVEMEKYAASFEEIIALIFSHLDGILAFDQYDLDKNLPEKPPCPCCE